jgi:hypothetical protein
MKLRKDLLLSSEAHDTRIERAEVADTTGEERLQQDAGGPLLEKNLRGQPTAVKIINIEQL